MTVEIKKGKCNDFNTYVGGMRTRYDYNVIDGGKHVATFVPSHYGNEYRLVDLEGKSIVSKCGWFTKTVTSKAKMVDMYVSAKLEGYIPTHMHYELRRMKEAMAEQRKCVNDYAYFRSHMLKINAEALLAASEAVLRTDTLEDAIALHGIINTIKYTKEEN